MVKKWDIVFISLDPITGSEQGGKRPVLVISNNMVNNNLPIFTCIPFSSIKGNEKIYPTELYLSSEESGLNKNSVLMIHQIRTVSSSRVIGKKLSEIKDNHLKDKINEAIKDYFELDSQLSIN